MKYWIIDLEGYGSGTPETDKAERMAFSQEYMVPTEFARQLERERNQLLEKIEKTMEENK